MDGGRNEVELEMKLWDDLRTKRGGLVWFGANAGCAGALALAQGRACVSRTPRAIALNKEQGCAGERVWAGPMPGAMGSDMGREEGSGDAEGGGWNTGGDLGLSLWIASRILQSPDAAWRCQVETSGGSDVGGST